MYRLSKLIKCSKNSIKWQNIQYLKKLNMEQVQLALMQQPIQQINQFSTQKLAHISNNFRVSRQDLLQANNKALKFDGKLHLDLKIDKILLQIQQCKVNLAQILQLYLPRSANSIQFKQLKLSNLKPSQQEQQIPISNIIQQSSKKNIIQNELNIGRKSSRKSRSDKFSNLRREDSYQINALNQIQNSNKQFPEFNQPNKQRNQIQNIEKKLQNVNLSSSNQEKMQTILQKNLSGKQSAKVLTQQLNQQKMSTISTNMIQQQQIINSSDKQILQKIQKQLSTFKKTLMLRQAQFGMLIFITQMKHDQFFIQKYRQIYQSLKQYTIPADKISSHVNIYILQQVFQIQSQFLSQYLKYVDEIKYRMQDYKKSQKQNMSIYSLSSLTKQNPFKKLQKALKSVFKLKIINSKIITIAEIFPYACIKDLKDLFSYSPSHERWQKLIHQDIITYKIYGQPQKVRKSFQSLKNNLNVINASMNILSQSSNLSVLDYNNWGKKFQMASKILKVALFKNDALHEASVMISEPSGKLAKQIWNLPQNKTLQNFISAVLPSIEFSQKIYIPRVLKQYFQKRGKQQLPDSFYINHITQYGNQLFQKAPYQKKIVCRINAKHRIHRKYQTKTKDELQKQINQNKKPQSYSKMFFNTLNSMTNIVSNINTYFKKRGQNQSTAILHIHGGGFISMSSFIHQTYTRNWANNLQVPILSVDYGKAPQYPFPQGLYDCLEAYMWLRFVFRQIYNCEVQKVIIVGDSAGGNLAAALTTLLIQWNLPKPDGLVLVYPALNLNYNNYTPSLLHALNDMILPHTFLKICLKAYIKDTSLNPQKDPLLSPILTRNQTLKKYPRTKIFVGGKDPFHDDCCKFVQKLNQQKKGIADLTIFDEFPHGFLQFDMTTYPQQQSRKATKQVQKGLKQVMQYKQK